jgi:hypothetical protein
MMLLVISMVAEYGAKITADAIPKSSISESQPMIFGTSRDLY